MKKETKQKIDNIVEATGLSENGKKTLRDLITAIYLDGITEGLERAREILKPETINVGDEDHNLEVPISYIDTQPKDDLPF